MKKLRRDFNRFCLRNRDKGIPNLMLWVSLGTFAVYLISSIDPSGMLPYWLFFDRDLILRGQVWRLFSFVFLDFSSNILWLAIFLLCYYSLGRAIENIWGTLRFNLFYFTGILLMDVYCMIFGGYASVTYLNLSLFLSYATLYPNAQFLLFFIIPVKAWIFALFDLLLVVFDLMVNPFPYNLFAVISLANYFLFFGKDVLNVVPLSWRVNAGRLFKKQPAKKTKIIQFDAGSYESTKATPKAPYNHRCTICGRTDITNPELEFRYCSRCKGYHCYCEEHISNHSHIQ